MPEAGNYLLTYVGFSKSEEPVLVLQQGSKIIPLHPLKQIITLAFDTSVRYCTGWYDMRTGEDHVCPEQATTSSTYEQCSACQKRTGFNPAFYHATSVSDQQEERNLQPHMLYLAHFGAGIIKVGISHVARGNSRLLEQGARSALILDTFPTAHITRQYEAKIATLPAIVETVQLRKKIATLSQIYDAASVKDELRETRTRIEATLGLTFTKNSVKTLDSTFFPTTLPNLKSVHDLSDHSLISGKAIGMLGSLLFCQQRGETVFLPLKKYLGFTATLSYKETRVTLPAQQTSLF